jgi:hypothetical protein
MRGIPQDRVNVRREAKDVPFAYKRYLPIGILALAMVASTSVTSSAGSIEDCPFYGPVRVAGNVTIPFIGEVSGVVASHTNPVLWIEEDSGNPERIYAIDGDGTARATVDVKNSDNRDWEDIALTGHRLWLADIGDNHAERDSIQVYWFPEPTLSASSVTARLLTLRYGDGIARNAEAMVVDGSHKKLFIFTKGSGSSTVFRAPVAHLRGGESVTLRQIAQLPLNQVTAADIGPRGVIVKAGDGFLYPWSADHRMVSTLAGTPCRAPAGPGESLAFSSDDRGLFAVPEGSGPSVYFTPPA